MSSCQTENEKEGKMLRSSELNAILRCEFFISVSYAFVVCMNICEFECTMAFHCPLLQSKKATETYGLPNILIQCKIVGIALK